MRRLTLTIISTLAAVILLFSYRTSTRAAGIADAVAQPPGIVTGPAPRGLATTAGKPGNGSDTAPKPASLTVNGPTAQTRYGPVQVQVTIAGQRIIGIKTLQHPSGDDRSVEIAANALPQLRAEALTAQSAHIDSVGGATYTSAGYQRSLQAALDFAHFR